MTCLRQRLQWVVLLYFIQGLPFGWFYQALPVYYRSQGTSLAAIGALTLLTLPWSLKFLWSPLIDRTGHARYWIAGALLTMAALTAVTGLNGASVAWGMLALFVLASATQDIAIDGCFVQLLSGAEQAAGNGVRVSAYRTAMIAGGGLTVMSAGFLPWSQVFWIMVAAFALLAMAALTVPVDRVVTERRPTREWIAGLGRWLARPATIPVFAFILLYKLGDQAMGPMVLPFWVDRGLPPEAIGFATSTLGTFATIGGALAGGWYTARRGVVEGLWVLGLAQAGSNLLYAVVAYLDAGSWSLWLAGLVESLSGGLGTAAFMSLLSVSCDREHAATQFAILSSLTGVSRFIAGPLSGLAAERLGYAPWFALTFLLALPAYLLLPFVSRWLAGTRPNQDASLSLA